MKKKVPFEQLLRWRFKHAAVEAPSRPKAARLLELAQPWWEKGPGKFQSQLKRLMKLQPIYGHDGNPVPVLIVRGEDESENYARIKYFNVRSAKLRLRFQLQTALTPMDPSFEVTFISDPGARPLFFAASNASADGTYQIDAMLQPEIARDWKSLKLTDRMPFRLILRPGPA